MQTILITGCSSGFGLETARLFLERGWRVVATMRNPNPSILPASENLTILPLDVTDEASVTSAIAAAGPLDALINNAGAGIMGALEGTSLAAARELLELNFFGVMAVTQAALPGFRARHGGVIVNVSSAITLKPLPLLSVYTASKAAIEAFTDVLSLELEPFGIRTRVVIPGSAPDTAFSATARSRSQDGIPLAYQDWAKQLFAGRKPPTAVTRPSEVAEAIWKAVNDHAMPRHIVVGADALALVTER